MCLLRPEAAVTRHWPGRMFPGRFHGLHTLGFGEGTPSKFLLRSARGHLRLYLALMRRWICLDPFHSSQ